MTSFALPFLLTDDHRGQLTFDWLVLLVTGEPKLFPEENPRRRSFCSVVSIRRRAYTHGAGMGRLDVRVRCPGRSADRGVCFRRSLKGGPPRPELRGTPDLRGGQQSWAGEPGEPPPADPYCTPHSSFLHPPQACTSVAPSRDDTVDIHFTFRKGVWRKDGEAAGVLCTAHLVGYVPWMYQIDATIVFLLLFSQASRCQSGTLVDLASVAFFPPSPSRLGHFHRSNSRHQRTPDAPGGGNYAALDRDLRLLMCPFPHKTRAAARVDGTRPR